VVFGKTELKFYDIFSSMTKNFSCLDVGQTCGWSTSADSEEELMKKIQEHAKEHGYDKVTPELVEKVKAAIKDE